MSPTLPGPDEIEALERLYALERRMERDRKRRKAKKVAGVILHCLVSPGTGGASWAEHERRGWR